MAAALGDTFLDVSISNSYVKRLKKKNGQDNVGQVVERVNGFSRWPEDLCLSVETLKHALWMSWPLVKCLRFGN